MPISIGICMLRGEKKIEREITKGIIERHTNQTMGIASLHRIQNVVTWLINYFFFFKSIYF